MPQFTPEGRRLLAGSHRGEFTLWNGLTFNFETIMQVPQALPFRGFHYVSRQPTSVSVVREGAHYRRMTHPSAP